MEQCGGFVKEAAEHKSDIKRDMPNFDTVLLHSNWSNLRRKYLRWLPRVITNIVLTERELENETWLISLKVFPRGDLPAWVLLK